jgi:hypothetical protein
MSITGIEVELIGHDGNAYAILGKVQKEMKRAGFVEEAKQYLAEATAGGYDNLLAVTMKYVEVV